MKQVSIGLVCVVCGFTLISGVLIGRSLPRDFELPPLRGKALVNKGSALYLDGKYDVPATADPPKLLESILMLEFALIEEPRNAEAMLTKASALLALGRNRRRNNREAEAAELFLSAQQAAKRALTAYKENTSKSWANCVLGDIAYQSGNPDLAQQHYKEAVKQDPSSEYAKAGEGDPSVSDRT